MNPLQNSEQRNLILAVLVSILILLGYDMYIRKTTPAPQPAEVLDAVASAPEQAPVATPAVVSTPPVEQLAAAVELNNMRQALTINAKGGRLVQLQLPTYHEEEEVERVTLLGERFHSVDTGWLGTGMVVPNVDTVWQVVSSTADQTTLRWRNNTGQVFERHISLNSETYEVVVTDRLSNTSTLPVALGHFAQLHHKGQPEGGTMYTYEGPFGYVNGERHKRKYKKLKKGAYEISGSTGWWGLTDHYFGAFLVPEQGGDYTFKFRSSGANQGTHTASIQSAQQTIAPGEVVERTTRLYAGPLSKPDLVAAGNDLDKAVDFGFFRILAGPLHSLMLWFNSFLGNMGFTIIAVTVLIKLLLFPLAQKSYRAMQTLKDLQPKMERLKEKVGDNKEQLGMEMMKLYREEKINPAAGCWPMLVQIPIFFAFYKVILVAFEFRQAEFILWWTDLSEKDPFFVLPVLMGLSMWLQMRLTPTPADETQRMIMRLMPWIFTAMFLMFPSGLVLYWLVSNVFAVGQQWLLLREKK